MKYYRAELVNNGWVVKDTANINGAQMLSFNKDTREMGILVAGSEQETAITISFSQK